MTSQDNALYTSLAVTFFVTVFAAVTGDPRFIVYMGMMGMVIWAQQLSGYVSSEMAVLSSSSGAKSA